MLGLLGNSPDESTLNVVWSPGPPYTEGYEVQYAAVSENSWRYLNTTEPNCQISGLASSTQYNITVVPYSINDEDVLRGPATSIILETAQHGEAMSNRILVTQRDSKNPFARLVLISNSKWQCHLS